jgi:hypothetical protein
LSPNLIISEGWPGYVTKILRLEVRADPDALLAAELLTVAMIFGTALALVLFLQRLS